MLERGGILVLCRLSLIIGWVLQAASLPVYNCAGGDQQMWSDAQVKFCCLSEGKGCPNSQAMANAGGDEDACSTACTHEGRSQTCRSVVEELAAEPALGTTHPCEKAHSSMLHRCPHCWVCSLADAGCTSTGAYSNAHRRFNCHASPVFHWSMEKKAWCCKHAQLGCPAAVKAVGVTIPPPVVDVPPAMPVATTPQPQGCDTPCAFKNQWVTCKDKILQAHRDAFRSTPQGCALARELALQVCPVCHVCPLASVGCKNAPTSITVTTTTTSTSTTTTSKTTTSKLFDCQAGYNAWEKGWSTAKKSWCCAHEDKGCETSSTTTTSLPFDCQAGLANFNDGWSQSKKTWCCDHEQIACTTTTTSKAPFDCEAGFSEWRDGWSRSKKVWCCAHRKRGCELPSAAEHIIWTSFQGHDYALVSEMASWDQQYATCISLGGYMVTLNSEEENAFVVSLMPTAHSAERWEWLWIGMKKVYLDSWIDGSRMTYMNWAKGQPSTRSTDQVCGDIYAPGSQTRQIWKDSACGHEYRTVCERNSTSSTSRPTPAHASSLFECSLLDSNNWTAVSPARRKWCCDKYDLHGCRPALNQSEASTTLYPYDCKEAAGDAPWSVHRRIWCCKVVGRGCPSTTTRGASVASSMQHAPREDVQALRVRPLTTTHGAPIVSSTPHIPREEAQALRVLLRKTSPQPANSEDDGAGNFLAVRDQPHADGPPVSRAEILTTWAFRGLGGAALAGVGVLMSVALFGQLCKNCAAQKEDTFHRVPEQDSDVSDSSRSITTSARNRECNTRTLVANLSGEPPQSARQSAPLDVHEWVKAQERAEREPSTPAHSEPPPTSPSAKRTPPSAAEESQVDLSPGKKSMKSLMERSSQLRRQRQRVEPPQAEPQAQPLLMPEQKLNTIRCVD